MTKKGAGYQGSLPKGAIVNRKNIKKFIKNVAFYVHLLYTMKVLTI